MEKLIAFVKQSGLSEDEAISRLESRLKQLATQKREREDNKQLLEWGREKQKEVKKMVEASRVGSSKLMNGSR